MEILRTARRLVAAAVMGRVKSVEAGLSRETRLSRNYPLQYFGCGTLCIVVGLFVFLAGRGYGLLLFGLIAYGFAWFYAVKRNWR